MAIMIKNPPKSKKYPQMLERFLPPMLVNELSSIKDPSLCIEEIRLRRDAPCSLSTSRGNIVLRSTVGRAEMKQILTAMSGYSLYAHSDTINSGYITLDGGIRVGICGRASIVEGKVGGVYDISALNIRIPRGIRSVGDRICSLVKEMRGSRGVLIYSPPGVGKTTLLRSVAYKMASGAEPWRVALIDTRGELGIFGEESNATIDILSGYPKGVGIEIAARTLNPQLMVCDEIGDIEEAMAIIGAQNCGVPLLASAHGENIASLMRRNAIRALHKAGVFGAYVLIERSLYVSEYKYIIHTAKEADGYI